jgi:hypothetical protein
MKVLKLAFPLVMACVVIAFGCSSYGGGSPLSPNTNNGITGASVNASNQTHLWGYFDVYIDIPTKTATAVINRQAMFTANVVQFLNGKPPKLGFKINDTPIGGDYVDVDIDVSLTHPFAGLTQYNGYDVRGVFMGDGSMVLQYNGELIRPVLGTDQSMLPDPVDQLGGPDGYTRWFNKTEFSGGMPLLSYTKGSLASPNFNGTATLCPYKYFADGLGKNDDVYTWLKDNPTSHGVFTAGSMNTRNYYLRFPNTKSIVYGYAVLANWTGETPEFHPSNAPESVAVSVSDNSTVFYASPSENGGDIIMDIGVMNWDSHVSTVPMEAYKIILESSVLTSNYAFSTTDMTPTGGGDNYSTYHVEIPADNVQAVEGNEIWVIVEQQGIDYTNTFGVTNLADTDPLAAFFRFDFKVEDQTGCPNPTVIGIDPAIVLADSSVNDVAIEGTGFLNGPSLAAKLSLTGQPDIIGTDVKWIDNSNITADFDLTGAIAGFWDVVVTNGCGNVGTGNGLLEIKSCGTMGGFSQNFNSIIVYGGLGDMPTYLSGVAATQSGTPYAISLANRTPSGGPDSFGYLAAIPTSIPDVGTPSFYSDSTGVGPIDRDVVCDSQNKVYFTDSSNYSRLRYCQFNETTGFGATTDFGTIASPWSIYRITIDENDNPVILATNGNTMRVFHWNSVASTWDTTDVPNTVFQSSPSSIGDFDYNPMFKHYVFVRRISNNQANLYAINKTGILVTTVTDIFGGFSANSGPGIYIDVKDPACRIVTWCGNVNFGVLSVPFTRMNAAYSGLVKTNIGVGNWNNSPNLSITGPRGQVSKNDGPELLCLSAHYINVYAQVPLPPDW